MRAEAADCHTMRSSACHHSNLRWHFILYNCLISSLCPTVPAVVYSNPISLSLHRRQITLLRSVSALPHFFLKEHRICDAVG